MTDGQGGGAARSRLSRWPGLRSRRPRSRTTAAVAASGTTRSATSSSDVPGAAELTDSNLVNAWGLSFGPTTPAWVADNGTDVSTLYSGGVGATPVAKVPLTVSIPGGAPTGTVFNGSTGFVVHSGASSGPARFLFSSEAGTITGWNPAVPPPPTSTQAQTAVTVPGAIFKGLAIADTATGPQIYATDFHNGAVDVWDANFAPGEAPRRVHRSRPSRPATRRSASRP